MKKVLFASTALVAFGLAGAAQAADPISLKLGGYSTWAFGYAEQSSAHERAIGTTIQSMDVKGTNEVWFLGSTTLDNGLKIGVDMQLEAGGQTDTTADPIDEAYITVDGAFGRVILGSENNGAYLLHAEAPDAAGLGNEAELGFIRGAWVNGNNNLTATGVASTSIGWTTAINTDNDAAKITYVSPSFAGFTLAGSYIPTAEGNPNGDIHVAALNNNLSDIVTLSGGYNGAFSGVGIKAAIGYAIVMDPNGVAGAAGIDSHEELSFGAQFSYAGFTLGGGYKFVDQERNDGRDGTQDGEVFNIGLMYSFAPFAVSFQYHASEFEGVVGGADDSADIFQFSGAYTMGPGVRAIASVGHVDYELNNVDANDGWAIIGGLALSF